MPATKLNLLHTIANKSYHLQTHYQTLVIYLKKPDMSKTSVSIDPDHAFQ